MMNKLGILGIVIAIAFAIAIITANPGAEGVSGWQGALIVINVELESLGNELESLGEVFEEFLDQEEISELFLFDFVSVEDQDSSSCADGQVVKRDSDSLTGWSCQDDDAGDGGDSDSIRLIPQKMEPEPCSEGTLGTMYFRDDPTVAEPSSLCVCKDIVGDGSDVIYMDATGNNVCTSP